MVYRRDPCRLWQDAKCPLPDGHHQLADGRHPSNLMRPMQPHLLFWVPGGASSSTSFLQFWTAVQEVALNVGSHLVWHKKSHWMLLQDQGGLHDQSMCFGKQLLVVSMQNYFGILRPAAALAGANTSLHFPCPPTPPPPPLPPACLPVHGQRK